MSIPVIRSSMPPMEEYMAEIAPLWESRYLSNHGEKARELERRAAEYLGADHAVSAVNGHQALELILQAMELKGEVITTPFTFVSTVAAIVRCGLTPVFCDIREDDCTLDPEKIEDLITEKTCAILPVHVYGNFCRVEEIDAIAKKHGLKVIYDAAHAFGATYRGQGAGSFGDASMFSFHATKAFHSAEGGLVTCRDAHLTNALWQLQNFGLGGAADVQRVAGNAKMNEFSAAMGLCNLRHLGEYLEGRKRAYLQYLSRLDGLRGVRLNRFAGGVEPNYTYFPVWIDPEEAGFSRDDLAEELEKHGIGSRKYFSPAVCDMAPYRKYDRGQTPIARKAASQVLTLPMYAELTQTEVDEICDVILKLCK